MGYKKGEVLKTAFETYTIVRPIGAGGSGEVYEVHDSEGRPWAVKVLDRGRASASRLRRFKNEIHFCARNTHRNIIQVQGSGVATDGATFYVMELYPGTLRHLISKGITPEAVLPYFGQILDGVEAAHIQNVWHRDVKPENILFSGSLLVVADFGIAHFEDEELLTAVETKNDERLANFLYSAPEQRVRGAKIDSKADVYALGLILNEMFTAAVPQGTLFRKVSETTANYPYLDSLIEVMLCQNPAQRPSIAEVKRELIARGNEFLSLQRLSELRSEVIAENEIDDPAIQNPLQIVEVDYQDGHLIVKLSAVPPQNWIMAFHRPMSSWSSYPGSGPESFNFRGNIASVPLRRGMDAQQLLRYTRQYVELANQQYAQRIAEEHRKKLAADRERRRAEIAAEEQRQKILRDLKL